MDQEIFKRDIKILPDSDCWWWAGSINKGGYGTCRTYNRENAAHRVSYMLYNNPIPEGMYVLHKCDHPRCVNPDHLFIGTHQENMIDRRIKAEGITPEQKKKQNAAAKRSERQRKRDSGLIPREVWIHPSRLDQLQGMEPRLRRPVKEHKRWCPKLTGGSGCWCNLPEKEAKRMRYTS